MFTDIASEDVLDQKLDWVMSHVFFHFYLYDEKPKYWDFELDWGISEVMHICKNI